LWAATVVIALTAVNLASLEASARTQNWLALLEVGGLLVVCAAGAVAAPHATTGAPWFASSPSAGMVGLAMVFVLLTYGGWNEAAYLSAEIKGGRRAIVVTLLVSIFIITALYVAANLAMLAGLPFDVLARSSAAPADLVVRTFGPLAGDVLAAFVAVATLTSINATMLVGARTNYALSDDWASLRLIGGWDAQRGVPTRALLAQGAMALALVAFGAAQRDGFEAMVEFTAPVFWAFLTLVGISLPVLRRRDSVAQRPFRVPLYPLTPLLFAATCAFLCYSSIGYAVSRSAIHVSLLVMAAGVAALAYTRYRARPPSS
jgi:amino acid transporter